MAKRVQSKIKQIEEKWDNTDRWVKRVLSAITTLGVIGGLFVGILGFFTNQLDSYLDDKLDGISVQIADLRSDSEQGDKALERSSIRVELMLLMQTDPTNTVAIEKMARYYFQSLNGDTYMSSLYSDWARYYGGDIALVVRD